MDVEFGGVLLLHFSLTQIGNVEYSFCLPAVTTEDN